jgi:hypothetical protein
MTWLLSFLSKFLAGPIIGQVTDAYKARLAAGNTETKIAADLAARELAVQAKEIEVQGQYRVASIGHWYEPEKLLGYAVAVYFAKLLIWDKVLALGTTEPLAGWASTTADLVVAAYFGKRTIENVVGLIRR